MQIYHNLKGIDNIIPQDFAMSGKVNSQNFVM